MKKLSCLLILSVALWGIGCAPPASINFVIVPASDGTPPTAGMTVNDGISNINVSETSQALNMPTNADVVTIIAGATDNDGGIKKVKLFVEVTKIIPTGQVGPGLYAGPNQENVSTAKVGELTRKNRFFQFPLNLKNERGNATSIRVRVWVEGENFHGRKVQTSIVSILYPANGQP